MENTRVGKREADDAELGAIFSALADPTRLRLVRLLGDGESTVNELAAHFELGVPAISKHLTVLERAGVISRHREAQWRHCRLESEAFERLRAWSDHYIALWSGSLDRLDAFLSTHDPAEGHEPARSNPDAAGSAR